MGALTLKNFSDELREWELIESDGFDPTDSFGVSLRMSIRERQIFLVEPFDPEMPWITDRGRLFFDGMFNQTPLFNDFQWSKFFENFLETVYFLDHFSKKKNTNDDMLFLFVLGQASVEVCSMLYMLQQKFSFINLKVNKPFKSHINNESRYSVLPSTNGQLPTGSQLALLINTNPRYEGYVLNLRLRQRFLKGNFKVFCVGSSLDLTFPTFFLGSNFGILKNIVEGSHSICRDLKKLRFPLVYSNSELFKREDAKVVFSTLQRLNLMKFSWNPFNVLGSDLSFSSLNFLNKFYEVGLKDFQTASSIYFVEVSLKSNSTLNTLTELSLLNLTKYNKVAMTVNHNSIWQEQTEIPKLFQNNYNYLEGSVAFEDNETFINSEGVLKRSSKLIETRKNQKTNWQVFRKLHSSLSKINFSTNLRNNQLMFLESVSGNVFKNYLTFIYSASHALTTLSFYLTKQQKAILFNETLTCSYKFTKAKLVDTKVKYWLDDFFLKNNQDFYSTKSYTLINSSKSVRASTTNFF